MIDREKIIKFIKNSTQKLSLVAVCLFLSACVTENFADKKHGSYQPLAAELNELSDTNYGQLMVKYNLLDLGKDVDASDEYDHVSYLYFLENTNSFTEKEYDAIRDKLDKEITRKFANKKTLLDKMNKRLDDKILSVANIVKSKQLPVADIAREAPEIAQAIAEVRSYKRTKTQVFGFNDLEAKFEILEKMDQVLEAVPLVRPLEHVRVTSNYGTRVHPITKRRHSHSGLDMVNDHDRKIHSASHGVVVVAQDSGHYGNMVEIDHGLGYTTRYGHLDNIYVKEGDVVGAGEIIGIQGQTGRANAEHLHYEVRFKDKTVNPTTYMNLAYKG